MLHVAAGYRGATLTAARSAGSQHCDAHTTTRPAPSPACPPPHPAAVTGASWSRVRPPLRRQMRGAHVRLGRQRRLCAPAILSGAGRRVTRMQSMVRRGTAARRDAAWPARRCIYKTARRCASRDQMVGSLMMGHGSPCRGCRRRGTAEAAPAMRATQRHGRHDGPRGPRHKPPRPHPPWPPHRPRTRRVAERHAAWRARSEAAERGLREGHPLLAPLLGR